MTIVSAHENEGLPIEEYMSGIPVHQDGSCNGLQHYAALGRDVNGAAAVNLIATETVNRQTFTLGFWM